jgi:hypothetical protein
LTLTSDDYWSLGLAIFLVLTGAALAWAFVALAATFRSLAALIAGTQDEVLPMINKVGATVDRINLQLDKLDKVTDSAVDAAASLDGAVRAISHLITAPVRKVSSVAAGLRYGGATLRKKRSWSEAVRDGKDAAARREQEVDEDLKPQEGARG